MVPWKHGKGPERNSLSTNYWPARMA